MLRMKGGIYIGFICERKTYRGFCNQVKNIKVAGFNGLLPVFWGQKVSKTPGQPPVNPNHLV